METEIEIAEPGAPDIRVARVFDRNWELLSPLLPVCVVKPLVHHHFMRTISYLLDQDLSRLAAQWEESVNATLWNIEKEAGRRLDELVGTIERLIAGSRNEREPQLRTDLARIEDARKPLEARNRC